MPGFAWPTDVERTTLTVSSPADVEDVACPPALASLLSALVLAVPFLALEGVQAALVYRDEKTDPHLHDRTQPSAVFGPPRDFRPVEVAGLLLRTKDEPLRFDGEYDKDASTRTRRATDELVRQAEGGSSFGGGGGGSGGGGGGGSW